MHGLTTHTTNCFVLGIMFIVHILLDRSLAAQYPYQGQTQIWRRQEAVWPKVCGYFLMGSAAF